MKLSIITINRNNDKGLCKTIESVISQTAFDQIEYIVIDGASTDGSKEVIMEFADKLTYWVSEPDKGIYNAMNKGIKVASGEYCQFLNSGDMLVSENTIERLLENLPDSPIVVGNMMKKLPSGKIYRDRGFRNGNISFLTFYSATINHSSAFIARNLFDKYGFYDVSLKIVSDWKWYLQVVGLNNTPVAFIDQDITLFDMTGISNSNPDIERAERRMVLEELIPAGILKDYDDNAEIILKADRLKRYRFLWFLTGVTERVLFKIEKLIR